MPIILIKALPYILATALISFIVYQVYDTGYSKAETKYKLLIADSNQKAMEEYNKAQFNAKQTQDMLIDKAKLAQVNYENQIDNYTSKLADTNNRMQHRPVCNKTSSSRMPESKNPEVPVDSTTEPELSEEFRRFLLSEMKRADMLGAYAQSTYEWVKSLCDSNEVLCD